MADDIIFLLTPDVGHDDPGPGPGPWRKRFLVPDQLRVGAALEPVSWQEQNVERRNVKQRNRTFIT